jgi:NADH-quinone oxidoreductase subunit N
MMFRAVLDAGTPAAIVLGVVAVINSVIAFFYYAAVARRMWFEEPAVETSRTVDIPVALGVAISLCAAMVLVIGVYPQLFARVGELARF